MAEGSSEKRSEEAADEEPEKKGRLRDSLPEVQALGWLLEQPPRRRPQPLPRCVYTKMAKSLNSSSSQNWSSVLPVFRIPAIDQESSISRERRWFKLGKKCPSCLSLDTRQLFFKSLHQIYKLHVHFVGPTWLFNLKKCDLAFCQLQFHAQLLPSPPSWHHPLGDSGVTDRLRACWSSQAFLWHEARKLNVTHVLSWNNF